MSNPTAFTFKRKALEKGSDKPIKQSFWIHLAGFHSLVARALAILAIPTSKSSNHLVWDYLLLRNPEPQIEVPQMRESWSWGIVKENSRNVTSLRCPIDELSYLGSSPIWSLSISLTHHSEVTFLLFFYDSPSFTTGTPSSPGCGSEAPSFMVGRYLPESPYTSGNEPIVKRRNY